MNFSTVAINRTSVKIQFIFSLFKISMITLLSATAVLIAGMKAEAVIGPVPANNVRLSDFGGVPNASSSTIISAFNQALARLKGLGGGTLTIDPGVYNFGSLGGGVAVNVSDLRNVVISAYGAQMRMSSSASTPVFFQFMNPNNVTIKGMSLYDSGTNLNINWRGAVCFYLLTTSPNSGFKTVDVLAENVVALLQAQQDSNYYTFEGFDIHATVKNAYYGVNPNMNGANSKANLTTVNVRRAFIGYGVKNWDITVNASADGVALGSNALIELAADNRGPVDGVNVNLTATGNLQNYQGLVTLFHQSSSSFRQYIRNVKANVTLNNLAAAPGSVFYFPYWDPNTNSIMNSTIGTWEQIQLSGAINGSFNGTLIKNPSISSGSTNSIQVASTIAAYQNMTALPLYFQVVQTPSPIPQPTPNPEPQPEPAISLVVQGAPNLPLNGTTTPVKVNFVSGTPTKVELSRDGISFAYWPTDSFFTLSADGKSLSGSWCITKSCWGGTGGLHVLKAVATYSNGATATASVTLNVADPIVSAPAPQISLTVQGAPNLPLNGTTTPVSVGFVTGTPTKVELSRDGISFALWPSDSFFTLASDGKSLSGSWCITKACWGGVGGTHILKAVATYSDGKTAMASVTLNVADPVSEPVVISRDASNVYINYNFSGTFQFHRVFIDSDQKPSTGYKVNGIGANYLIENGVLYRYTGRNGLWGWSQIRNISMSASATSMSLTIPYSLIGYPVSMRVSVVLSGTNSSLTLPIVSKTF